MNQHHLLLGQLEDIVTGQQINDTHDERYRQKIAHLLITEKGYAKSDLVRQYPLSIQVDATCAQVPVTFVVHHRGEAAMLIHYGPGSLVTRHRPALAMARLVAPHQLSVVVVTNGEQADILDGATGRIEATGLSDIPSHDELAQRMADFAAHPISAERAQKEARIVMAYEVNDRCPCDDSVCTLKRP